jgi:hypothetical protein
MTWPLGNFTLPLYPQYDLLTYTQGHGNSIRGCALNVEEYLSFNNYKLLVISTVKMTTLG